MKHILSLFLLILIGMTTSTAFAGDGELEQKQKIEVTDDFQPVSFDIVDFQVDFEQTPKPKTRKQRLRDRYRKIRSEFKKLYRKEINSLYDNPESVSLHIDPGWQILN
jgi:Skp family chaperone for outer membrane proteins